MLAVLLALLDFAFAQDAEQSQTLIVDGHPGQAAVIQVKGTPTLTWKRSRESSMAPSVLMAIKSS